MTTPVVLFTGFLGAGKTSLINWLLSRHSDCKISVIVNEFGSIKLESEFITRRSGDVIELANGCMCCVAKSDIPRTISLILEKSSATEYILIEASGLSDPDPILAVFQDPTLLERVHLECVVGVVDAINFFTTRQQFPIVTSQVADADLVVITKASEVSLENLEKVRDSLVSLDPHLRIIVLDEKTPADFFLGVEREQQLHDSKHDHVHTGMEIFEFFADGMVDLVYLTQVFRNLPATVIRAKGVVFFRDAGGLHKVLVSHVGMRTTYQEGHLQEGEQLRSTLLFLGTMLNKEELQTQLSECIHTPATAA